MPKPFTGRRKRQDASRSQSEARKTVSTHQRKRKEVGPVRWTRRGSRRPYGEQDSARKGRDQGAAVQEGPLERGSIALDKVAVDTLARWLKEIDETVNPDRIALETDAYAVASVIRPADRVPPDLDAVS